MSYKNIKANNYILRSVITCVVLLLVYSPTSVGAIGNSDAFSVKHPPVALIHKAIQEAGILIEGVSGWPVERIDFLPEATKEQRKNAWEIVKNFDYPKALAEVKAGQGLIMAYGSEIPKLTADGQISVANVNGNPYIYFQSNGVTQHILGASSFEISAKETIDALSGEKMKIGDFVIGMIDGDLKNGATPEESSLHGIWVKWSSVKADLIKEIKTSSGIASAGELAATDGTNLIEGINATSFTERVINSLAFLGIRIRDGIVAISNLAAEKLFADTARIKKLEMVDKATGDIYCTFIQNGEWQKLKGSCDSTDVKIQSAPLIQSVEPSVDNFIQDEIQVSELVKPQSDQSTEEQSLVDSPVEPIVDSPVEPIVVEESPVNAPLIEINAVQPEEAVPLNVDIDTGA